MPPWGYGSLTDLGGKTILAHRFSYELHVGPIDGHLLHSCDNPRCVNPAHLSVGTQKQNIQDAMSKGRINLSGLAASSQRTNRGSERPESKLTEAQVIEMRRRNQAGETNAALAIAFDISRTAVSLIVNRHRWKHVL